MQSAISAFLSSAILFIRFLKKIIITKEVGMLNGKIKTQFSCLNDQYVNNSDIDVLFFFFFFYKEITLDDSYL